MFCSSLTLFLPGFHSQTNKESFSVWIWKWHVDSIQWSIEPHHTTGAQRSCLSELFKSWRDFLNKPIANLTKKKGMVKIIYLLVKINDRMRHWHVSRLFVCMYNRHYDHAYVYSTIWRTSTNCRWTSRPSTFAAWHHQLSKLSWLRTWAGTKSTSFAFKRPKSTRSRTAASKTPGSCSFLDNVATMASALHSATNGAGGC